MIQNFILAESATDAASKTKEILAQVTAWKITQAFVILALAYAAIRLIDWLVIALSEKVAKEWRLRVKQFLPFLRMGVLTSALIILMNLFLNLSQENIFAVTGTVAVAVGFAFKDYVSSVIAGIIGIFEASYRVGDRVTIGGEYGEVIGYGLRGVRIQTPTDNIVTIPHNQIWTSGVSNANMGRLEAQVVTSFFLAHHVDVALVEKILYRVAHTSKYTHLQLPIVVIMEDCHWGSLFKLKCYPLDARNEFLYKSDLTRRAKYLFSKQQISYPQLLKIPDTAASATAHQ
ncbi:mechanosensitive ion channel [filamentous cyanobacterium LEGE 11480]|uniref:Mechanosensitive ion channel n=1 Tax=Romeriopsis navalis LEGE 11480 TaxID=2777977 RepID=A0A928Z5K5_9CYAN|nr:mechanosensitive ion channel domain-containing protein [Romeriopsis navalis]MBE9031370.1 mechanosensitive ion channel [Romeriopsis navalis LEGE 11480]